MRQTNIPIVRSPIIPYNHFLTGSGAGSLFEDKVYNGDRSKSLFDDNVESLFDDRVDLFFKDEVEPGNIMR